MTSLSSVTATRTRSPGNAWRTKTTRPSVHARRRCRRGRPHRRRARSSRPSVTRAGGGGRLDLERRGGRHRRRALPLDDPARRRQLVRHARHHHTGHEQQPALQPQRALVVQQVLPPVPDDVLGDEDETTSRGLAAVDRLTYLMIGRVISRYGESRIMSGTGMPRRSHSSCSASVCRRRRCRPSSPRASTAGSHWRMTARSVALCSFDTRTMAWTRVGRTSSSSSGHELVADQVVVAADAPHHREEHDHRDDRDPGALGELGDRRSPARVP